METFFHVLVGATVLVGLAVALYGLYGLIAGQVHTLDQESGRIHEITGGKARRFGLYYLLAGALWVNYAAWKFIDGL